jgi:L-iditol 2-dehydrogenase
MISCGQCAFCRNGQQHLCDRREVLGVSCGDYRRHGAFAEYVSVPEPIVYPLPDGLPLEHAAMLEAAAVALHAVRRSDVALGDAAVVVGSGMIGLLIVQALRLVGCTPLIAVDLDDGRLALAAELGADHVLNPGCCDAIDQVMRHTAGRGADVAIEAVGASEPVETAIRSVRKGGTVTLVGNVTPTVSLPLQAVVTRELKIAGSCASNGEFSTCIELVADGKLRVEPLISIAAPLEEGPRWFDRLHAGPSGLMKVILRPTPSHNR